MKIKQNIPWYRTKYLDKKNWLIKKSPNYLFYYFKNSLAEKNIKEIIKIKEKHYSKILSFLKIKNCRKIQYYFYPTIKEKKKLMGDNNFGNAIWEELELKNSRAKTKRFEIHVAYNNKCKFIGEHEDTHLLSLSWGLSIYLFQEGLAQFMEENLFGKDIDNLSKKLLKQNKLYSTKWLCNNKNWDRLRPEIIYSQSGSFVRYLINTYGLKKFKKLYKKTARQKTPKENIKIIEIIYSQSIKKIEKNWRKYLKSNYS
ncbi:hypothetical protein AMJ49_06745 [Parcubacteria bacterium DG_74_2]|nr:MAG: hypothetical protein AMJ49_06745 [Parcubacteria bacterium DG_74_2]